MINDSSADPLAALGLRSSAQLQASRTPKSDLGQEDFLRLMIAQLRNQDPMKPMENGEFLGQIAQFGTVKGIQDLQDSFVSLSKSLYSNQALQAANIVGRSVMAPTGLGLLPQGGAVRGAVEVPASSPEVTVMVHDGRGQLIRRVELGPQAAGQASFQWDGLADNGQFAPPGTYLISASAQYNGRSEALETLTASNVESVTLNQSGGLLLHLQGVGPLAFSDVRQIM